MNIRADDPEYQRQIENEKQEFDLKSYDQQSLLEQATAALNHTLETFDNKVSRTIGQSIWDYVVAQVDARPGAKVLSIGSGPCGVELALARRFAGGFELTCLDLNDKLLELGQQKAREHGIEIKTIAQDANFLKLEETYDVMLAHASLHHFIRFEHIFQELSGHLAPTGVFIAHEPVPRNGMLMWPETKRVVDRLFATLPAWYRRVWEDGKHTVLSEFREVDYTQDAFECIRSEEIVPLLESTFDVEAKVAGFAFARRFVDGSLGANYDLSSEADRTVLNLLLAFDDMMTEGGVLKPENVFMVMRRKAATRYFT